MNRIWLKLSAVVAALFLGVAMAQPVSANACCQAGIIKGWGTDNGCNPIDYSTGLPIAGLSGHIYMRSSGTGLTAGPLGGGQHSPTAGYYYAWARPNVLYIENKLNHTVKLSFGQYNSKDGEEGFLYHEPVFGYYGHPTDSSIASIPGNGSNGFHGGASFTPYNTQLQVPYQYGAAQFLLIFEYTHPNGFKSYMRCKLNTPPNLVGVG